MDKIVEPAREIDRDAALELEPAGVGARPSARITHRRHLRALREHERHRLGRAESAWRPNVAAIPDRAPDMQACHVLSHAFALFRVPYAPSPSLECLPPGGGT